MCTLNFITVRMMFCQIVLLNTVKCLIIMHCGVLCYPVLSSWDKKIVVFSKKGPIFLKKGVKNRSKKSKSGRIFKLFFNSVWPFAQAKNTVQTAQ